MNVFRKNKLIFDFEYNKKNGIINKKMVIEINFEIKIDYNLM